MGVFFSFRHTKIPRQDLCIVFLYTHKSDAQATSINNICGWQGHFSWYSGAAFEIFISASKMIWLDAGKDYCCVEVALKGVSLSAKLFKSKEHLKYKHVAIAQSMMVAEQKPKCIYLSSCVYLFFNHLEVKWVFENVAFYINIKVLTKIWFMGIN